MVGNMRGFHCKFLAESNSKRVLNIGQHLPKLCLRLEWHAFLTHAVVSDDVICHPVYEYMAPAGINELFTW